MSRDTPTLWASQTEDGDQTWSVAELSTAVEMYRRLSDVPGGALDDVSARNSGYSLRSLRSFR